MCGLCGMFGIADHWSDSVADDGTARTARAERERRLEAARILLHPFGLVLKGWSGRYVLATRTGKSAVVEHLGALWPTAEKLTGRPCDPLDPAFLDRLAQG